MSEHNRKAVVLAAGRGTRMKHLTDSLPKPMLPLSGKPMLEHVLERLGAAGVDEVVIVTGYRAELIESHFAEYPLRVHFRRQDKIDGTARAALLAQDVFTDREFILTFGDIITDPADYDGIARILEADAQVELAVGVKYVDDPHKGAAVYQVNGRVQRIVEKPAPGTSTTHWNSAGLYMFRPSIFPELARAPISERGEYEIPTAVTQMLDAGRDVRMYAMQGGWMDVGRPEDLAGAERLV